MSFANNPLVLITLGVLVAVITLSSESSLIASSMAKGSTVTKQDFENKKKVDELHNKTKVNELYSKMEEELNNKMEELNNTMEKLYNKMDEMQKSTNTKSTRIVAANVLAISPALGTKETKKQKGNLYVSDYIDKVDKAEKRGIQQQCGTEQRQIDMNFALSCLQMTTPSLKLEYPADAEQHFAEIHRAMAPWAQHRAHRFHHAQNYGGPWIENHWISLFEGLYSNDDKAEKHNATCLSDIFGPFIPLFIPWTDHFVNSHFKYPPKLADTLVSVLRPNVPYITVSQNADGLPGRSPLLTMDKIPNVLVLSAGGYGHVPLPLLKQVEPLNNQKNISNRTFLVSYVGGLGNAPRNMRVNMSETLEKLAVSRNFQYKYFYGQTWRDVMADSRFSLSPRGFGRTAYHVVESLQMGLIPIQVYTDTPWVPYARIYDKVGFKTDLQGLEALVTQLQNMTEKDIHERERLVESLRESHFSFDGVLRQIAGFLSGAETDLVCQQLPSSVRDA